MIMVAVRSFGVYTDHGRDVQLGFDFPLGGHSRGGEKASQELH